MPSSSWPGLTSDCGASQEKQKPRSLSSGGSSTRHAYYLFILEMSQRKLVDEKTFAGKKQDAKEHVPSRCSEIKGWYAFLHHLSPDFSCTTVPLSSFPTSLTQGPFFSGAQTRAAVLLCICLNLTLRMNPFPLTPTTPNSISGFLKEEKETKEVPKPRAW